MPYLSNIPQGNDQLQISQPQFLNNFTDIFQLWAVEHSPLSTTSNPNANQGYHNATSMFTNNVFQNIVPNIANTEIILGNQLDTNTQQNELTLKRNNETYSIFTSKLSDFGQITDVKQQIRLTSGILIRYGNFSFNNGGQVTATLIVGQGYIPFTTVYNVLVTPVAVNGVTDLYVRLMSFTTTTVTVFVTNRTTTNMANVVGSCAVLIIGR